MGQAIAIALLTAAGLSIGSFLNVCIYRLPRDQSIVRPASRCPACGRQLRWYENVPLVGYLALGGRCSGCRQPISLQYPLVEAATASVFLLHYWYLGWEPVLVSRLVFASAMIALFVIDLQHRILPNLITLPGTAVGFAFSLFLPPGWISSALGILAGGGVLLAIAETYYRLRNEEGLGMGDVKMLAMIGAFLGLPLMLVTLVLSSFVGALIGVALIASGKGGLKYALPFGTFLALAAVAAGLVGDDLVRWYLSFY